MKNPEISGVGSAGQPNPSQGAEKSGNVFGRTVKSGLQAVGGLAAGAVSGGVGIARDIGARVVSVPGGIVGWFVSVFGKPEDGAEQTAKAAVGVCQDFNDTTNSITIDQLLNGFTSDYNLTDSTVIEDLSEYDITQADITTVDKNSQSATVQSDGKKAQAFVGLREHLGQISKLAQKFVNFSATKTEHYKNLGENIQEAQKQLQEARKAFEAQKANVRFLATDPKSKDQSKQAEQGLHNMGAALIQMEKKLGQLGQDYAAYVKTHDKTDDLRKEGPSERPESAKLERDIRSLQRDMEHYLTGCSKVLDGINGNESIADKFQSRETWAIVKAFLASATGVAGMVGAIALAVAAVVGTGGLALIVGGAIGAFASAGVGLAALYKAYKEGEKAIEASALKGENLENFKSEIDDLIDNLKSIAGKTGIYAETVLDEAGGILTDEEGNWKVDSQDNYARCLLLMSPDQCLKWVNENINFNDPKSLKNWSSVLAMMMENDPTATLERVQHWPMAMTAAILSAAMTNKEGIIDTTGKEYKDGAYMAAQVLSSWFEKAPHTVTAILHQMGNTGDATLAERIKSGNKPDKTENQKFVQAVLIEMAKSLGKSAVNDDLTKSLNEERLSTTLAKMKPEQAALQLKQMTSSEARYDAIRGMPVKNAAAIFEAMVKAEDTEEAALLWAQCKVRPEAVIHYMVQSKSGLGAAVKMMEVLALPYEVSDFNLSFRKGYEIIIDNPLIDQNSILLKTLQQLPADKVGGLLDGMEAESASKLLLLCLEVRNEEIANRQAGGLLRGIQNFFTSPPPPVSDLLAAMKPEKAAAALQNIADNEQKAQLIGGLSVGELGKILSVVDNLYERDEHVEGYANMLLQLREKQDGGMKPNEKEENRLMQTSNMARFESYAHIFNGLAKNKDSLNTACELLVNIWNKEKSETGSSSIATNLRDHRIQNAFHLMDFGTRLQVLSEIHKTHSTEARDMVDALYPYVNVDGMTKEQEDAAQELNSWVKSYIANPSTLEKLKHDIQSNPKLLAAIGILATAPVTVPLAAAAAAGYGLAAVAYENYQIGKTTGIGLAQGIQGLKSWVEGTESTGDESSTANVVEASSEKRIHLGGVKYEFTTFDPNKKQAVEAFQKLQNISDYSVLPNVLTKVLPFSGSKMEGHFKDFIQALKKWQPTGDEVKEKQDLAIKAAEFVCHYRAQAIINPKKGMQFPEGVKNFTGNTKKIAEQDIDTLVIIGEAYQRGNISDKLETMLQETLSAVNIDLDNTDNRTEMQKMLNIQIGRVLVDKYRKENNITVNMDSSLASESDELLAE